MITEEIILRILKNNGFYPSSFQIKFCRTLDGQIGDIYIESDASRFHFYCFSGSIDFCRKIIDKKKNKTFHEWERFFRSSQTIKAKFADEISIDLCCLIDNYIPFLQDMINLIKRKEYNQRVVEDFIVLVPIDSEKNTSVKNQNWYNKLLEDYTQYCQSDNKSDIVEKHYQEQARLHGLKFVTR